MKWVVVFLVAVMLATCESEKSFVNQREYGKVAKNINIKSHVFAMVRRIDG